MARAGDIADRLKPVRESGPTRLIFCPKPSNRHASDDQERVSGGPHRLRVLIGRVGDLLRSWVAKRSNSAISSTGALSLWGRCRLVVLATETRQPYIAIVSLLFAAGALSLRYHRPMMGAALAALALLSIGALLAAWRPHASALSF